MNTVFPVTRAPVIAPYCATVLPICTYVIYIYLFYYCSMCDTSCRTVKPWSVVSRQICRIVRYVTSCRTVKVELGLPALPHHEVINDGLSVATKVVYEALIPWLDKPFDYEFTNSTLHGTRRAAQVFSQVCRSRPGCFAFAICAVCVFQQHTVCSAAY